MKDAYLKALMEISADKSPPPATSMTKAEIEAAIVMVSSALKGPMPNVDRLDAVEYRAALRKQLAALPA